MKLIFEQKDAAKDISYEISDDITIRVIESLTSKSQSLELKDETEQNLLDDTWHKIKSDIKLDNLQQVTVQLAAHKSCSVQNITGIEFNITYAREAVDASKTLVITYEM